MKQLIDHLVSSGVLKSRGIIEAFQRIDRADFVPDEFRDSAYVDEPLPIGYGQTISQPWTVAFMLELLAPEGGESILDIGSGSGWQTALLAYIVSHDREGNEFSENQSGRVIGIEVIPELARRGRENLFKYNFIKRGIAEIHCLNAAKGYPGVREFDRIIAAASATEIPDAWKRQVKIGGRIVAPVGSHIVVMKKENQKDFTIERHEGFAFVPFVEK